jgi:hypothetical protein
MSLFAPRSAYEAAWQQWNYGGGAQRGEPMPRPEDYPAPMQTLPLGRVTDTLPPMPSDWPSPMSRKTPFDGSMGMPAGNGHMDARPRGRRTLRSFGSY